MQRVKLIVSCAAFIVVCLLSLTDAAAQNSAAKPAEPSYEVLLQIVVASNNSAEKPNLPPTLSNVVKKLKNDFQFTEFRLSATLMQRVSNNGSLEYKGANYEIGQNKSFPVFTDWTISGFQNIADNAGQEVFQIQTFRFGQRIPITDVSAATSYEPIGLATKFSLPKNTPTVVGTLANAQSGELMFLILTVKPAEK